MMTIAQVMQKMIDASQGNRHDIEHFIKVWSYARTIGQLEGLDAETQRTLEIAAIIHDIACPLCREKYGNTEGKNQERESPALVTAFLEDSGLPEETAARVNALVSRHHTLTGIDGMDCQILIEADYLVNAGEQGYTKENVRRFMEIIAKTSAGRALLRAVYGL